MWWPDEGTSVVSAQRELLRSSVRVWTWPLTTTAAPPVARRGRLCVQVGWWLEGPLVVGRERLGRPGAGGGGRGLLRAAGPPRGAGADRPGRKGGVWGGAPAGGPLFLFWGGGVLP